MTTGAGAASEGDISARVDGKAVVLVLDVGVGDGDASGAADVESVGVVAAIRNITSRVVDGDVVKCKVGGAVDREALDRGILDVEAVDLGRCQGMCVEEL